MTKNKIKRNRDPNERKRARLHDLSVLVNTAAAELRECERRLEEAKNGYASACMAYYEESEAQAKEAAK